MGDVAREQLRQIDHFSVISEPSVAREINLLETSHGDGW